MMAAVPAMLAAAPGIINGIGSLFGGGGNQSQQNQQTQQAYNPFLQGGQKAFNQARGGYSNMVKDPTGLMQQFGNEYQASPGYQYSVDQATKAAGQAAASGGMAGSLAHQTALSKEVSGLAGQDYYKYLDNALGLYGNGLQGLGGLAGMGMGAAGGIAQNNANQQFMDYIQKQNQQSGMSDMFSGLRGMYDSYQQQPNYGQQQMPMPFQR